MERVEPPRFPGPDAPTGYDRQPRSVLCSGCFREIVEGQECLLDGADVYCNIDCYLAAWDLNVKRGRLVIDAAGWPVGVRP